MLDLLLSEISNSPLLMRDSAVHTVEMIRQKLLKGEKLEIQQPPKLRVAGSINASNDIQGNPFDAYEENSIAVLPIIGNMFKYGFFNWDGIYIPGMDDIANLQRLACESPNIIGTIFYFNTPGVTAQSVIQLEDALRNRTKPCVAFIDGACCSGGIYIASFCDKIIASNPMCEVGSVGVQMSLHDLSKMYESMGVKILTFRPPASRFKNTEYEEAIDGNDERLQTEVLMPFAEHFQGIIKENRPQLDTSVEGLIEGKVFYAQAAMPNGLIDSIGNYSTAVETIISLSSTQKTIYSSF